MVRELLLPQNDPKGQEQRARYLQKQRQFYEYYYTLDRNVARLKTLRLREWLRPLFLLKSAFRWLLLVPMLILALVKMFIKGFPFKAYKDYFLFSLFPYPFKQFLDNFDDDVYLGLQRVAGVNPTLIEGLTEENPLPENFQAKDIVGRLANQPYEEALRDRRLYITDYSMLQPMVENPGELGGRKKYPTSPIALYYRQDDGLLKPLAIQLYATKSTGSDNPIFTPSDGNHWLMARAFAQSADVNLQDTWIHAVFLHFVMEGIILGTYRNFARNHPLYALLYPHTEITFLLDGLFPYFDPPPTVLTRLFSPTPETTVAFVGEGMRKYNFKDLMFPNDIKQRNMEDQKLYYPYRDDGQLVWDAIHEFVREYVNAYYKSDRDVVLDLELQAWGDEIGGSLEQQKLGIPGFPTQFKTVDEVVETVGNIIFFATAKHNCINYAQYQYSTFIPNNPFSIYAPPIIDLDKPISQEDLISFVSPSKKTALDQTFLFYLTGFKVNRLGNYRLGNFDQATQQIIKKFQKNLKEVSREVKARNQERAFPYSLMDPDNIPNSITA